MIKSLIRNCLPLVILSALLFLAGRSTTVLWLSAGILACAAVLMTLALLRLAATAYWIPLRIPYYTYPLILLGAGWVAAATVLARHDTSAILRYGSLTMAVLAGVGVLRILPAIAISSLAFNQLRREYRHGGPPTTDVPFVLVSTASARSAAEVRKLVLEAVRLLRHTHFGGLTSRVWLALSDLNAKADEYIEQNDLRPAGGFGSELRTMFLSFRFALRSAPRFVWKYALPSVVPAYLITSRDLEHYPTEFAEYIRTYASATITVAPLTGHLIRWLDGPDVDPLPEADEGATEGGALGYVGTAARAISSRLLSGIERREKEMLSTAHLVSGPAILIWPQPLTMLRPPPLGLDGPSNDEVSLDGYDQAIGTALGPVAPVIERLGRTILPLARSDDALPLSLRQTSLRLAREGLPSIADVYLRFRLSSSNVERFLCLLDGFEVLMKYSVFASLVTADDSESRRRSLAQRVPAAGMGTWLELLVELLRDQEHPSPMSALRDFWEDRLALPPGELINAANGVGLSRGGDIPRTHLDLLQWLTWLRNATRGHGAVVEVMAAPIWHPLHETFLLSVQELSDLTFDARLIAVGNEGDEDTVLFGWRRGPLRSSDLLASGSEIPVPRATGGWCRTRLRWQEREYRLDPFIWARDRSCYVWKGMAGRKAFSNDARTKRVDCIDYGTGQIERIEVDLPSD